MAVMKPLFVSCVIGFVSFAGCHRPAAPLDPTQGTVLATNDDDFHRLWEACQAVLRRHRFEIDRKDLRAGLITTFPQTSQHFLEFWRHDVDTPYDLAESSVSTVRRSVTIQISKPQDEGEYTIDVAVNKERLHAVERQINSTAAALRVFSADLPTTAGRKFDPATDMTWTPEGRDAAMEKRLLEVIRKRCEAH